MIILLEKDCQGAAREKLLESLHTLGYRPEGIEWQGKRAYRLRSQFRGIDGAILGRLQGVKEFLPFADSSPGKAVSTSNRGTEPVKIGDHRIGTGTMTIIAGPCAVEDEAGLFAAAEAAKSGGAQMLRGGAYKPRTSPYSFQGLGQQGLGLLVRAREEFGLPFVTEALDEDSFDRVEAVADVIQIGSRNMHNSSLLKRAGKSQRPILLKRGMSATLEELLMAAEYVLDGGNRSLFLCERGVRAFPDHSRFTLDLSIIPALRRFSELPLLVDPSHAGGMADYVAPLARAAVAAGADGVMIEIHKNPATARCDGPQALTPQAFLSLAGDLRSIHEVLRTVGVSP